MGQRFTRRSTQALYELRMIKGELKALTKSTSEPSGEGKLPQPLKSKCHESHHICATTPHKLPIRRQWEADEHSPILNGNQPCLVALLRHRYSPGRGGGPGGRGRPLRVLLLQKRLATRAKIIDAATSEIAEDEGKDDGIV